MLICSKFWNEKLWLFQNFSFSKLQDFWIQSYVICKKRYFYFFLSNLDAFYFFFLLNWSESPRQMLNEKSRQACLPLNLRGKACFIFKKEISCCLWVVFIMLKFPSISSLLSVFIMKEFYFCYIQKCRCSILPLFSLFPFFSLVCSPFFDFFPEPSRTSGWHQERRNHGLLCIHSLKCPVSGIRHPSLLSALQT